MYDNRRPFGFSNTGCWVNAELTTTQKHSPHADHGCGAVSEEVVVVVCSLSVDTIHHLFMNNYPIFLLYFFIAEAPVPYPSHPLFLFPLFPPHISVLPCMSV